MFIQTVPGKCCTTQGSQDNKPSGPIGPLSCLQIKLPSLPIQTGAQENSHGGTVQIRNLQGVEEFGSFDAYAWGDAFSEIH